MSEDVDQRAGVNGACRARGASRHKPGLLQILRSVGLDVSYHRGLGDFVYYRDEHGAEIEVLDLIAGYGTLLLGHNHPTIAQEAARFHSLGRPNHVQGSVREPAQRLADELARRAQRDVCVVFANSGAEAVEVAMKHALLETGGRSFLALEGAFHGKTLGAGQLTANPAYREPFTIAEFNVVRIQPGSIEQLEASFERVTDPAGFFFEPILGEGGVRPVSPAFIRRMCELCRGRNVPLIADECQTGLGRTGSFLASQALEVRADYVILSKALGGGLAKISAVLIDRKRYVPAFDLVHTSTFADDDFSCAIALKTLELVDQPLMDACREKGNWLLDQLEALRRAYPTVVADVRGAGLMLGIELMEHSRSTSLLLRQLTARGLLGALVCGHMLKTQRIRIATTLSEPLTLRIQPSALVSEASLRRLVNALAEICALLEKQDVIALTAHLPRGDSQGEQAAGLWPPKPPVVTFGAPRSAARSPAGRRSFAWLFHLIDAQDVPHLEPGLARCSLAQRNTFLNRLAPLAEPVVMPAVTIASAVGGSIGVWPILLPVTSAWLKQQVDFRRLRELTTLLVRATEVAESLGADLVSLGQFTSIVSGNGRNVSAGRLGLTTGNSYTAALVIEAVRRAQAERGMPLGASTLAVVGAAGNIGSACAEILAPEYGRVILVGRDRPAARQQLRALARRIGGAEVSCDLSAVLAADVVVCTTNCVEPVLAAEHLRPGAIVCDASVPRTVVPGTARERPDLTLFRGGVARLPFGERLTIPGFPLPAGYTFGCMAEGAILCFEEVRDASFTGRLCPEKIARIAQLAQRHGFEPAGCGDFEAAHSNGEAPCRS